jgi:hypothetical protein
MIHLTLFFTVWVAVAAVGINQRRSKFLSIGIGYLASLGVFFVSLALFDESVQTDDSSIQISRAPSAQPVPQQARQAPKHAYLSETALICRAADQVPQFLADLKNKRAPNMVDCAYNPTKERTRVDIVARQTIGQETLVHWRKPTNGFEGWTLESNLALVASR